MSARSGSGSIECAGEMRYRVERVGLQVGELRLEEVGVAGVLDALSCSSSSSNNNESPDGASMRAGRTEDESDESVRLAPARRTIIDVILDA